jgi:hypothetical protein
VSEIASQLLRAVVRRVSLALLITLKLVLPKQGDACYYERTYVIKLVEALMR